MSDEDVWVDFDGDGESDSYETEELANGDTAYISEDGEVAVDEDGDGVMETLYTDEDGDGKLDTEMTDVDGDGFMDEETSFEGDPLAEEEGKGGESGEGEKSDGEKSGEEPPTGGGEGGLDGLFS